MRFGALIAVLLIVLCPDHGVKATPTGNKRFADKRTYCEYEHPTSMGTHKFWQECPK
jgi:hypothetical protein